jgi:diguanylate cyclase (GGDEF)-like protein
VIGADLTPPVERPQRILLAEDDDDIGRYVELALAVEGFEIHRAVDGVAAVAKAIETVPDLVLLDIGMPGLDGVSVCEELRRDPRTAAVPIIMLTARVQSADKVLGLGAGADDYMCKPFDPAELVARVNAALRRNRQLRDVSPLTGLPGNIAIFRQLELLLASDIDFAVAHVDLDHFKAFNDRYGFAAGDEVIKATAAVLVNVLEAIGRQPAFAGHVGGDDFVVVTPADAIEAYAKQVVRAFDEIVPAYYDPADRERGAIEVRSRQGELRQYPLITISLGIVLSSARSFDSPAEVASLAAEMKNVAKAVDSSSWCVNRRTA